jgi:hypothetical protein
VASLPYFLAHTQRQLVLLANFILLLDAFLHPIIKVVNFSDISKRLFGEYLRTMPDSKNVYPQTYLNKLLEGPKFKLEENYHYVLRGLFLSTFFAYSVPLSFLYYALAIMIEYVVQRYLLLRVCKVPPRISSELAKMSMRVLGMLPAMMILGSIVYKELETPLTLADQWLQIIFFAVSIGFAIVYELYCRRFPNDFVQTKPYSACFPKIP